MTNYNNNDSSTWQSMPRDLIIHEIAPFLENYQRFELGIRLCKLPRVKLRQERIDVLQNAHLFPLEKSVKWARQWNESSCAARIGGVKRKDNFTVYFVMAKTWDPYYFALRTGELKTTKFSKYFKEGGHIGTVVHWHK
jgi:hypothetical protein